jgi:N-acylneuraminate cytidylyltransferase
VDHALEAGISRCIVSTDIAEILHTRHEAAVDVIARPASLAQDDTPMDAVIADALARSIDGPTTIVLLQATSPLRQPEDIARAVELFATGRHELVLSATPVSSGVLKYGLGVEGRFLPINEARYCFMNRQQLPPVYRPNGAVYVFDADWFTANGSLASCSIGFIEMPEDRSLDIDTAQDFERISALFAAEQPT